VDALIISSGIGTARVIALAQRTIAAPCRRRLVRLDALVVDFQVAGGLPGVDCGGRRDHGKQEEDQARDGERRDDGRPDDQ
jgi:hypothetical protein